jgi:hypothetical protein
VYHTNLPLPHPPLPAANLGLKVNIGSYINVYRVSQEETLPKFFTFLPGHPLYYWAI